MGPDPKDLDFCKSITRKGGSNLWLVSRSLPLPKQRLFNACYASMRYIDDRVDEGFQTLPQEQREMSRPVFRHEVDIWQEQSVISVENSGEVDTDNPIYPVFSAIQKTAGLSNLTAAPWKGLAEAMISDINEAPLVTWEDFDRYAEGATVCPTAVYLYILLCSYDRTTGSYSLEMDMNDLFDCARSMAVFCYLVHIIRDLKIDLKTGGRLVTIPQDVLSDLDLKNPEHEHIILDQLLSRAFYFETIMVDQVNKAKHQMAAREAFVFSGLLGIYQKMFRKFCLAHQGTKSEMAS